MDRMLRNLKATGENGLWVYGRAEMSTAKALVRRGLARLEKGDRNILYFVKNHEEAL